MEDEIKRLKQHTQDMFDHIGKLTNENEELRVKLAQAEAREAVLVEALQKIANKAGYAKLDEDGGPDKWDLHRDRNDRILWAHDALKNTSEQAKALLAVVGAARDRLNHPSDEVFPHAGGFDKDCRLCILVAAHDKLTGGPNDHR